MMLQIAHFGADVVIFTQNNPRQEPPNHIIDDMVQGLPYRVREAYPETEQHYMSDPGRCDSVRCCSLQLSCGTNAACTLRAFDQRARSSHGS
jgi:hypothetical protein